MSEAEPIRKEKTTKKNKHVSCCGKCGDYQKEHHKIEAFVKPEVDKNICRDIFCKDHYQRPVMMPSKFKSTQLPPPPPPPTMPFNHQQRLMYPPAAPQSPQFYPYHVMWPYGYPTWGGYRG